MSGRTIMFLWLYEKLPKGERLCSHGLTRNCRGANDYALMALREIAGGRAIMLSWLYEKLPTGERLCSHGFTRNCRSGRTIMFS